MLNVKKRAGQKKQHGGGIDVHDQMISWTLVSPGLWLCLCGHAAN
jgi:hypothetical protein